MSLPIQTSADDASKVCEYLRTKATGAAISDVGAIVGAKYVDKRKLQAYEAWGVVERSGSSMSATPLGRQLAQAGGEELVRKVFATVIVSVSAYRKALEYIRSQGLVEITNVDLAAWWHQHLSAEIGLTSDKSLVSAANSFLSLLEAAGVGTFTLGRRGAASRLTGIDVQRAAEVLDGTPKVESTVPEIEETADEGESDETAVIDSGATHESGTPGIRRVFIAHGKNMEIVQQISDMLRVSGLESEVAEEDETTAIPVPDKVSEAMHRCQAGIVCVTREPGDDVDLRINENVLIEIGAAFVLYEKQVILVWDKSLPVPSNLQGLYRCELEENKMSWDEGMKLLRAIGKFRSEAVQS